MKHIKSSTQYAVIKAPENLSPHRSLPVNESVAEPYDYDKPFGSNVKGNVDMGRKYESKPNNNPAPGQYDVDHSIDAIKPKVKCSANMNISTYGDQSPARNLNMVKTSGADQVYDSHLTAFGSDLGKVYMGIRYKDQVNNYPGPGYYDPEQAESQTKLNTSVGGAISVPVMK